ncbi:hypothetical protein Tfu_0233 [Thermobifida fusca YX]|uniref:Uncharacterized protein n=1 Tax=Thermobifida fusca (strain YX) TaxID=269800 RepID=Q47TE3_THEFY|nr:hypothetical protein Tfu_0233 [Thermobifida fusca YX]
MPLRYPVTDPQRSLQPFRAAMPLRPAPARGEPLRSPGDNPHRGHDRSRTVLPRAGGARHPPAPSAARAAPRSPRQATGLFGTPPQILM